MRLAQIALLVGGITCNAAVQYQFSYTALNGPIKSFSYSFSAPGYLGSGAMPTVPAFTPTDGNKWLDVHQRVWLVLANPALGCFLFGTQSTD